MHGSGQVYSNYLKLFNCPMPFLPHSWYQCFCLFAKNTDITFRLCKEGGRGHTWQEAVLSHDGHDLVVGVSQMPVPGVNFYRLLCSG